MPVAQNHGQKSLRIDLKTYFIFLIDQRVLTYINTLFMDNINAKFAISLTGGIKYYICAQSVNSANIDRENAECASKRKSLPR